MERSTAIPALVPDEVTTSPGDAPTRTRRLARSTPWTLLAAVLAVAAYSGLTADATRAAARAATAGEDASAQELAGSFALFFTFALNIGTVLMLALCVRLLVSAVAKGARWGDHRRRLVGAVAQLVLHAGVLVLVAVRLVAG